MRIDSNLKEANLQTRSERAGDEPGKGAVTMRLTGTVPAAEAALLFSTESSYDRLLGSMWNDDGELTSSDAKELALNASILGGAATVSDQLGEVHEFDQVKVDSVKITALAGRQCEVDMKMHLYPTAESLWFLFTHQQLAIKVTCTAGQKTIEEGIEEAGDENTEQGADGDLPLTPPGGDEASTTDAFAGMTVE